MTEKIKVGEEFIFSGKPTHNKRGGGLEIIHPDTDSGPDEGSESLEIGRIVPVYHSTEGLHLKSLRTIIKNVVDDYKDLVEEFLPEEILKRYKFPKRNEAIQLAHFPPTNTPTDLLEKFQYPAQRRLIFEEFFLLQLALAFKKRHTRSKNADVPLKLVAKPSVNFSNSLNSI